MHIEEDRTRMVFKSENGDKVFYSIGLSRKDKDGNYINGYLGCRFPKDTNLGNKTKIKILEGWIDFYLKDKATVPYLFINKYEVVEDKEEEKIDVPTNSKTVYEDEDSSIQLTDEDLPF